MKLIFGHHGAKKLLFLSCLLRLLGTLALDGTETRGDLLLCQSMESTLIFLANAMWTGQYWRDTAIWIALSSRLKIKPSLAGIYWAFHVTSRAACSNQCPSGPAASAL